MTADQLSKKELDKLKKQYAALDDATRTFISWAEYLDDCDRYFLVVSDQGGIDSIEYIGVQHCDDLEALEDEAREDYSTVVMVYCMTASTLAADAATINAALVDAGLWGQQL